MEEGQNYLYFSFPIKSKPRGLLIKAQIKKHRIWKPNHCLNQDNPKKGRKWDEKEERRRK